MCLTISVYAECVERGAEPGSMSEPVYTAGVQYHAEAEVGGRRKPISEPHLTAV